MAAFMFISLFFLLLRYTSRCTYLPSTYAHPYLTSWLVRPSPNIRQRNFILRYTDQRICFSYHSRHPDFVFTPELIAGRKRWQQSRIRVNINEIEMYERTYVSMEVVCSYWLQIVIQQLVNTHTHAHHPKVSSTPNKPHTTSHKTNRSVGINVF